MARWEVVEVIFTSGLHFLLEESAARADFREDSVAALCAGSVQSDHSFFESRGNERKVFWEVML